LYFLPLLVFNKNRNHVDIIAPSSTLPSLKEFLQMSLTFVLTVLAWVFFRAANLNHALQYLDGIANITLFEMPRFQGFEKAMSTLIFLIFFIAIEWKGRKSHYAIES